MMRLWLLTLLVGDTGVQSFAFFGNKRGVVGFAPRTSSPLDFATSSDELYGLSIPDGLRDTLIRNAPDEFAKRIWIVDNSGSMKYWDGHMVLNKDACTRWDELKETVTCHAQLSAALQLPTEFRMLNGHDSFRVGYGSRCNRDVKRSQAVLAKSHPQGQTPLHTRLEQVRREVVRMLPQLGDSKVAVVICTDGCNFDVESDSFDQVQLNQEFVQALEALQGLPVHVVIRLCTDFGPIVDFYNNLDERLDLKLDVLDDHEAEALEVYGHNKWLNYALVLHRMREMGQCDPLFDLLDERAFTKDEIQDFCKLIFGPDKIRSTENWADFCNQVEQVQDSERMHWNPLTKELSPWIDVEELELLDCIDVDDYLMEESV